MTKEIQNPNQQKAAKNAKARGWILRIAVLLLIGCGVGAAESLHILNTVPVGRKTEFNLIDFGARTNVDCQLALTSAIAAASAVPGGGVVVLPEIYPLSTLDITNSNFTLKGGGGLLCASNVPSDGTWIKVTGSNVFWRSLSLDGNKNVRNMVRCGNYSTNWAFENVWANHAQINTNNGVTDGGLNVFLFGDGCRNIDFLHCRVSDCDSLIHSTADSAACRAIRFSCFPATTNWVVDRFEDVRIKDCNFFNFCRAEKNSDAICLQNQPANAEGDQVARAEISGNWFSDIGYRAIKLEVGGADTHDNWIFITQPGPNPDWTFAGISGYGPFNSIHHNHIIGGSSFYGIEVAWLPTFGLPRHCTVSDNEVYFNATGNDFSYGILFKGAADSTLSGNTVRNARIGYEILGNCNGITATGNIENNSALYGFYVDQETDTNQAWFGVGQNITIGQTVIHGAGGNGVRVDHGTNVVVIGTTGTATGQVVFMSTNVVNAIPKGNVGATEPVLASSSSASYYLRIDATAASAGSIKFFGPFENQFMSYDDNVGGVSQLNLGRTSGNVIIGGILFNRNSQRLATGSGSPEGAVTATVGSIYMRTDGGAGTSFYVKESGSGNTGWVAK